MPDDTQASGTASADSKPATVAEVLDDYDNLIVPVREALKAAADHQRQNGDRR